MSTLSSGEMVDDDEAGEGDFEGDVPELPDVESMTVEQMQRQILQNMTLLSAQLLTTNQVATRAAQTQARAERNTWAAAPFRNARRSAAPSSCSLAC